MVSTAVLGNATKSAAATPTLAELIRAQNFYAERFREEQPQAGWQNLPAGLSDLRASTCGRCHQEIYKEWQVSTHAQAWSDTQFQSEITKSENRWLCNNCHTPLLNQMEAWVVGLEDNDVEKPVYTANTEFEPEFRGEGITCAACHVRDSFVEGPTGVTTEAHPTRRSERFTSASICLSCHQAVRSYPGKDFICVFETGDEWREGPYGKAQQSCQVCHMQPVERPMAEGSPPRSGRRHYFPGSGIYKRTDFGPPLDQLAPGLGITTSETQDTFVIQLENSFSGHYLPTGDPERFIQVEVTFFDGSGETTGPIYTERIGQVWKWWPEPVKLDDTRLAPLESREIRFQKPPSALRWSVIARSHRISDEAAIYHHLVDYPSSRITHELVGQFPESQP